MRRGKKQNYNKNFVAFKEWMEGKKIGRRKQEWIWFAEPTKMGEPLGYWRKCRGSLIPLVD